MSQQSKGPGTAPSDFCRKKRRSAIVGSFVAQKPPTASEWPPTYFVVEPNRGQLAELASLADQGSLRPAIGEVFPLADARAAFERSLAGHERGKIVLRIGSDDRDEFSRSFPS